MRRTGSAKSSILRERSGIHKPFETLYILVIRLIRPDDKVIWLSWPFKQCSAVISFMYMSVYVSQYSCLTCYCFMI